MKILFSKVIRQNTTSEISDFWTSVENVTGFSSHLPYIMYVCTWERWEFWDIFLRILNQIILKTSSADTFGSGHFVILKFNLIFKVAKCFREKSSSSLSKRNCANDSFLYFRQLLFSILMSWEFNRTFI